MTQHSTAKHKVTPITHARKASRWPFHDIRSPEILARYPLIGLAMFLGGGIVFGVLAYHVVTNGSLLAWDVPLARSLHADSLESGRWIRWIMIAGYYVGDQLIAVIGVLLAIYFIFKRYWQELVMLACGFGLSALLFLALAYTFDRPRPVFETEIWGAGPAAGLPGFPSGHAIAVFSSYGLLTYFLVPKIRSRSRQVIAVVGMFVLSLYVNFSRLFLCDHFLTDIIAGSAVGVAWFGLSQTVVERLFRKPSA